MWMAWRSHLNRYAGRPPYFLNLTVKSNKTGRSAYCRDALPRPSAPTAHEPAGCGHRCRRQAVRGAWRYGRSERRIGSARFSTKTNATTLDTFKAPEEGYLGVIVGKSPTLKPESTRSTPLARYLTYVMSRCCQKSTLFMVIRTTLNTCTMRPFSIKWMALFTLVCRFPVSVRSSAGIKSGESRCAGGSRQPHRQRYCPRGQRATWPGVRFAQPGQGAYSADAVADQHP